MGGWLVVCCRAFLFSEKGRGQLCFLPEVFFVLFCVFCLALRGFLLRVVSLRTGCTGVALVIPSTSTDAGVASVLIVEVALVREMRMAAKAMVRMVVFIPFFVLFYGCKVTAGKQGVQSHAEGIIQRVGTESVAFRTHSKNKIPTCGYDAILPQSKNIRKFARLSKDKNKT